MKRDEIIIGILRYTIELVIVALQFIILESRRKYYSICVYFFKNHLAYIIFSDNQSSITDYLCLSLLM